MLSVGWPVACDRADGVEASLLAPPPFICEYQPRLKSSQWGVKGFDQGNLLASTPAFELLLAVDGGPHIVKRLPVEQAIHIVSTGKTVKDMFFVLEHAILRAAGDADVQVPDRLPIM